MRTVRLSDGRLAGREAGLLDCKEITSGAKVDRAPVLKICKCQIRSENVEKRVRQTTFRALLDAAVPSDNLERRGPICDQSTKLLAFPIKIMDVQWLSRPLYLHRKVIRLLFDCYQRPVRLREKSHRSKLATCSCGSLLFIWMITTNTAVSIFRSSLTSTRRRIACSMRRRLRWNCHHRVRRLMVAPIFIRTAHPHRDSYRASHRSAGTWSSTSLCDAPKGRVIVFFNKLKYLSIND